MTSSFLRFLDHTQRRITVGRTPLDEWSARRRDFYLTTHNTHNRQTFMPPVGFEPTISAGERPQTYAFDRADTGSGTNGTIRRPKFRMRVFRVALKGISVTFNVQVAKIGIYERRIILWKIAAGNEVCPTASAVEKDGGREPVRDTGAILCCICFCLTRKYHYPLKCVIPVVCIWTNKWVCSQ